MSRITPERVRALLAEWDTAVAGDDPEGCGTCAACSRWCLARAAMHAAAPDLAADLLDALDGHRTRADAAEAECARLRECLARANGTIEETERARYAAEDDRAAAVADRDYWREQATGMAPSVDGMRALGTRLVPGGTGCVVDPERVVAEVERLRERVIEAEAEAIRWGDALVAIGEAAGLTGAGSAEIVAAVTALVTERNRAKSDLADNDLILEERECQLNVAVTAYHTLVDAVTEYLSAADEYAYGDGEDTNTLDGCRQVLDEVFGSVK